MIGRRPAAFAMKTLALLVAAALVSGSPAAAAPPSALKPELAGMGFLVGGWSAGRGQVADTGGASTGGSTFTAEAGGAALLRRDHTELFDKAGKPTGGFDQIMLIYPDAGAVHADYSDGTHVIHYASAQVEPGRSVTFLGAAQPGAPTFRLAYRLEGADHLRVEFSMAPPGASTFRPIATGVLTKAPS